MTENLIFAKSDKNHFSKVRILYVYCTHSVRLLYVYGTYSVRILYVYCTYSVRLLYAFCTFPERILYVYCTFTVCILSVFCTFTVRILYVYCTHSVCLLYVFSAYSLLICVICTYSARILYLFWILNDWLKLIICVDSIIPRKNFDFSTFKHFGTFIITVQDAKRFKTDYRVFWTENIKSVVQKTNVAGTIGNVRLFPNTPFKGTVHVI